MTKRKPPSVSSEMFHVVPRLILKHFNVVNCQLPMPTMPSDRLVPVATEQRCSVSGFSVEDGTGTMMKLS